MPTIQVDPQKCTCCGRCVSDCPLRILSMGDDGPAVNPGEDALCISCGHCVAVCPEAALDQAEVPVDGCAEVEPRLVPSAGQMEQFLRSRRSIRQYKSEPVPIEVLARLIRLACSAPSGHNSQPWEWLVVSGTDEVQALAGHVLGWMRWIEDHQPELFRLLHLDRVLSAASRGEDRILRGAPHLIVVHAAKDNRFAPAACVNALAYLELAAPGLGLGTCWAGYFTAAANAFGALQGALGLPEGHVVYGAAMVGRPAVEYPRLPVRREPRITWRERRPDG